MSNPVEMDQDIARQLFSEGAILILLNVPEGTEFGIDMKSWNTGDKFKGVKMIPPGLHYVYYSSVNTSTGDSGHMSGFFHHFEPREIFIKYWDTAAEDLSNVVATAEDIERIKSNLLNLDKYLGPYPYEIYDMWKSLINYLSKDLVKKFEPSSGIVRSALELQSCSNQDRHEDIISCKRTRRTNWAGVGDDIMLPNLKPLPGTAPKLTQLPPRYPEGSTPEEVTKYCLDSSFALKSLLSMYSDPINILGELQFSFVIFLVGHSLEGFEHWKKLVDMICTSESALRSYVTVYSHLLPVLHTQIQHIPNEFLVDIVEGDSFVYVKCRELFINIYNSGLDNLRRRVDRMIEDFKERFDWDFDDLLEDDPDDRPVIVNLDEPIESH